MARPPRIDPAQARDAGLAQAALLRSAVSALPASALDRPTRLAGLDVRSLVAAIEVSVEGLAAGLVDATAMFCGQLVVHALDLQQAVGVPATPAEAVHPSSLAVAVRVCAAMLQQRAPGHSVEVRIPGPAGTAFQCGDGPEHTRGTPPNVIETDPVTFVELGAGRLQWASAVGSGVARASGARADLSGLLPVIG